jgi:hypothetical protein
MHVSSVSSAFTRVLQVLYLNVSKIDLVFHLSPRLLLLALVSPPPPDADWASTAFSLSPLGAGYVGMAQAPRGRPKW